jgi:hypothetical protein
VWSEKKPLVMSGFFYRLKRKMKMKKAAILLICGLTGLLVLFFLLRQGDEQLESPAVSSSVLERTPSAPSKQIKKSNVLPSPTTGAKILPEKSQASQRTESNKNSESVAVTTAPKPDPETALKKWDDRLVLYYAEGAKERVKDTPVTVEEQVEMRELFNALAPEAKLENINHAVNLLPDETVSVLNGILLDTAQPAEVLGVIFHDMLNRDEAIKNPLMEEIVKNKAHPMYVESARILDIVK